MTLLTTVRAASDTTTSTTIIIIVAIIVIVTFIAFLFHLAVFTSSQVLRHRLPLSPRCLHIISGPPSSPSSFISLSSHHLRSSVIAFLFHLAVFTSSHVLRHRLPLSPRCLHIISGPPSSPSSFTSLSSRHLRSSVIAFVAHKPPSSEKEQQGDKDAINDFAETLHWTALGTLAWC